MTLLRFLLMLPIFLTIFLAGVWVGKLIERETTQYFERTDHGSIHVRGRR